MADIDQMRQKFFADKRTNIDRDANRAMQEQNDMLTRRFAAIGQSGSGAQIGAQMKASNDVNEAKSKAVDALSGQELEAQMQEAQAQKQRDFMSGEAQKGRDFEAGQGDIMRKFQSGEAKLGRDFQSGESRLGREFQGGLADKDMALKREFFGVEQGNKLKEFDLAERQFALDKDTTEFNKQLAMIESNRKPPGMFDSLGIPGLSTPGDFFKKTVLPSNPITGGGGK